ncbi:hypothetical protein [Agriterribacter sp.]|uniref:hypothetical protein n=1 Tax=Agriterribacter sp. TaxID=2821509 RepID=UPI002CA81269|nr:hypothetical protein [Agriterribacter sp.]HRP55740.1 hypothetical protein [Agriterribacter sp.]
MKLPIVFILLIVACNCPCGEKNSGSMYSGVTLANTEDIFPDIHDLYDYRSLRPIDISLISDTQQLAKYVVDMFGEEVQWIKPTTVILKEASVDVMGLGNSLIYELEYGESFPSIMPTRGYLIISRKLQKAAVLYLDDLRLIKISPLDKTYLLGGFYQVRAKGYFHIYEKQDSLLSIVFTTLDTSNCANGIPVTNYDLGCISYEPFQLNFSNEDVNHDGLNDLTFKGKVNYYCEGFEWNIGRKDRKPFRSENVKITFLAEKRGDRAFWKLYDTTICKKLNQQ